ncbi:MAG: DUF3362 domain-containing protein, partial [Clostridia bacterium]|nr:DUF3362 domain-containing protein [Clostridia bacterium]
VQDFYPTPGTASTVMYYTGLNPLNMKPVHVTTDYHEKQLQRALLQYNRPQNASLVREALTKAGRTDLIGTLPDCLVPPEHRTPTMPRKRTSTKKALPKGRVEAAKSGKNTKRTPKNPPKRKDRKR